MILQPEFDSFVGKIRLGNNQVKKIETALGALSTYLQQQYGLRDDQIILQGSYANGTAVKPAPSREGGEYDVDLIILCASGSTSPDEALDGLEAVLAANGRYKDRLKPKNPCIRIEYAEDDIGRFHIDVVPARIGSASPVEVPRRGDGWYPSAPHEYSEWCKAKGDLFARTVQTFKRWRDENQTVRFGVKSIVLQVLVANCFIDDDADMIRLSTVLDKMESLLAAHPSAPPALLNPVLQSENLTARWPQNAYKDFRRRVSEFAGVARTSLTSNSEGEAGQVLAAELGSDFPVDTETPNLSLGSFAHAKSAEDEWIMQLGSGHSIAISASVHWRPGSAAIISNYRSGGMPLKAGWKIRYDATSNGNAGCEVRWQVVNTGAHAEFAQSLRGDTFFPGKELGGQPTNAPVNWESAGYTGTHWIEAFLVRDGVCLARSGRFLVNVDNPTRKFRFRR